MISENMIVIGVKGIIVHNGKVLIIKRAQDAHVGGHTWECPGGKLEFGESLEEALIREAKEEVGLDIQVEELLYATTFNTSSTRQVVLLTFRCSCKENTITLSNEHSEFYWANKDELYESLPVHILTDFQKYNIFELLN
ncbi:NUDIX domain-containing protein [Bacillus carboniphilus]|uniref:NUDIX domain-containing protein n=1 Tax=Bacillus carboniphilus TaxID=86663 RepID=A0ABN0W9G2_9BACI